MAKARVTSRATLPPLVVETPPVLSELDRGIARLWRRWRAIGGDGRWYHAIESGFVVWAREQGVDVPPLLAGRPSPEAIDEWAKAQQDEHSAWNPEVRVRVP